MQIEKAMLAVINLTDAAAMNQLQTKSISNFTEEAAKALRGNRRTGTIRQNMTKVFGSRFRLLEVQYNPATLQMSVTAENARIKNFQTAVSSEALQQENKPMSASLSMDLVVTGEHTRIKVNGLMGMLENDLTSEVIFCWGNMVFPGKVTGVSASYTMFSDAGAPLMGKISLTVEQESQTEAEYWTKAFERLFQNRRDRRKNL